MKTRYLLLAFAAAALAFASCKNNNEDSVSGIVINGTVTDADGNSISGLRISTLHKTRSAYTRAETGTPQEDSIANAEKGFVLWKGDTGQIIVPDTITTNSKGEYTILNKGENFNFTGTLPIVVIDKDGAFVSKTSTVSVSAADYKPAAGYSSFAEKRLDFTLQAVE